MKNLRKLSTSDLKAINGGSAPECPQGFKPCMVIGENDTPKWTCVWASLPCKP